MNRIDEMIKETLSREDEALLREQGSEPGYFRQAFAIFRGPLGWVMWLVFLVQLALAVGFVWTLIELFQATETIAAVRWACVSVLLLQTMTFLRGFMGAHFESNRVLRAVARLELRLVARADQAGDDAA